MLILLSACAQRAQLRPAPGLAIITDNSVLPEPARGDLSSGERASLIGPLDVIEVGVFGVPELSRELQVDLSGQITMPLVGQVDARGKTPLELSEEIASRLRGRYVRDPDVTINVKSSVSQVVTVDGEVKEPGLYPVTNQTTLMRAIASAKGLSEFGKATDVVILRQVNGQRMAGLYNLSAIRRGVYPDPSIFANDVVVVGDSPARRLFGDVVATAPLLAAPLVAIIQ
ncbi:polysaccharide biosynthesis/export family protein [Sphingomonas changnyeongensis]|uniref:polysaccharide biosynthesis/export family protein n=1 Tax=Sphingomonas changnyeongensis TaxID=2698679 RepID=UPI001E329272|nr:polysaccharide biosynthesis/export family protein [Sphingomonas changnyeongensis]